MGVAVNSSCTRKRRTSRAPFSKNSPHGKGDRKETRARRQDLALKLPTSRENGKEGDRNGDSQKFVGCFFPPPRYLREIKKTQKWSLRVRKTESFAHKGRGPAWTARKTGRTA